MIEKIRNIICPSVILNFETDKGILSLKENSTESQLTQLLIEHIPEGSLAFTLDYSTSKKPHFQQLSCYLNKAEKGINKGCDLILIFIKDNKNYILIFDLKSRKPNKADTEIQLMNSKIYIEFLINIVQQHYKINCDNLIFVQRAGVTKPRVMSPKVATSPIRHTNKYQEDKCQGFKFIHIEKIARNVGRISLNRLIS